MKSHCTVPVGNQTENEDEKEKKKIKPQFYVEYLTTQNKYKDDNSSHLRFETISNFKWKHKNPKTLYT